MTNTIIAVDPGKLGGIAYQLPGSLSACMSMPDTEGDLVEELRLIKRGAGLDSAWDTPIAYVEQVGGFIKGNPAPGSAMFRFGRGYGFILGVLQTLGYRIELVTPQKWQSVLGLRKSEGDKKAHKNRLKSRAQQLYPHLGKQVTLNTSDALLILEYAMQQREPGRRGDRH